MKFLCSHCKAKYQIADEKVAGRTLRMTCRQCKRDIVIRGESPAVAGARPLEVAAPSSPLHSEFRRHLSAPPAPAAPPDEWHVGIDDVPVGPLTFDEVARKIAAGKVDANSVAWREGMEDWRPIRTIPELYALCPSHAPPPLHHLVAHSHAHSHPPPQLPPRHEGSRSGPLPAGAGEEWAGQAGHRDATSPSQVTPNPLGAQAPLPESIPRSQISVPLMFALAGFMAFVLTATAIVGVKLLKDEPASQPVQPPPGGATAGPQEAAEPPPAEQGGAGAPMVFDLDDVESQEQEDNPPRKRAAGGEGKSGAPKAGASSGKKQLTDEQRAMLERMNGSSGLSNLERESSGTRNRAARGSLSAAQLSAVVSKGKRNLQRCYETALRQSGITDTVRLDVGLTISPNGNVTKVSVKGKGLPGLDTCIKRTARVWRFPASSDSVQTNFPLVFSPGS